MKKCLIIVLILILLVGLVGCAGGEIGFEAVVDRVEPENNMAYATVTRQHRELLSLKLPERIMFSTSGLDTELKPGDRFQGDYLSGTIDGQSVRVVCVIIPSE